MYNSYRIMSSHVYTWLIAFCVGVAASHRPITEELTSVTCFPGVEDVFIRLHPEINISTTDPQIPTLNSGVDAKTQFSQKGEPEAVSYVMRNDSHHHTDGSEMSAATKEKICHHISSSTLFNINSVIPYPPNEHKMSLLRNHPRIFAHLFGFPKFTLSNVSKKVGLYIEGREDPYVERMFSCVMKDERDDVYEYRVSDREYNMSTNPTEYIAGRFVAGYVPAEFSINLFALAEEPATVVIPQNEAPLYESFLKEKHPTSSERKYPIIRRLSEFQTLRLCSAVMNGIKKSFVEHLQFAPKWENLTECREEKKIFRLKVERGPDRIFNEERPWMITCEGKSKSQIYNLIQADDDQMGVFVTNDENGEEVVRFYASRIAALTEVQDWQY